VEILLLEGIVLVVVAPSAPERRPQPHGSGRLHPVDQILVVVLRRNRATLVVDHVVAIEAGGDLPLERRVWQKVSSQLLDRKIATGFNRNHMINYEGGAIPAE